MVLFDGYCNLCNGAVAFIIKRDPREKFRFASLSWAISNRVIGHNEDLKEIDSIILFENNEVYFKSSAALRIAGKLKGLWPLLKVLLIIPRFLRDPLYDFIARNRYRWFGKKEACMIPEKNLSYLFVGEEKLKSLSS